VSASASADPRRHGIVERYSAERKFGFVRADDFTRLFFHKGGIIDAASWTPSPGDRVVFDRELGREGPRCFHVRLDDL
jgi:cold shock CspA family protein